MARASNAILAAASFLIIDCGGAPRSASAIARSLKLMSARTSLTRRIEGGLDRPLQNPHEAEIGNHSKRGSKCL
jgi:hypothetical protein